MIPHSTADVAIIGSGIAGMALADALRRRDVQVAVFDSPERSAVSRGAGLISPVAGLRFGILENWQQWWDAAIRLYQRYDAVEPIRCLRLLYRDDEVRFWNRKHAALAGEGVAHPTALPAWIAEIVAPAQTSIEITTAARIRAARVLDRLIVQLAATGSFHARTVAGSDIVIREDSVNVCGIECAHVVFCEGAWMAGNALFAWIPPMFARGQRIRGRIEGVCVDDTVWLSIRGRSLVLEPPNLFSYGSSYDWLSVEPAVENASTGHLYEELTAILRARVHIEHVWGGVRPIVADLRPVIGKHPQWSCVWIFNGLGSRGLLLAPFLAEYLANAMVAGSSIPSEWNVDRFADRISQCSNADTA